MMFRISGWFMFLCAMWVMGCGSGEVDPNQAARSQEALATIQQITAFPTANGSTFNLAVIGSNVSSFYISKPTDSVTGLRTPNAQQFDRLDLTVNRTSTEESRSLQLTLDKGIAGPVLAGDAFPVAQVLSVGGASAAYSETANQTGDKGGQGSSVSRAFVATGGSVQVVEVNANSVLVRLTGVQFAPALADGSSGVSINGDILVVF